MSRKKKQENQNLNQNQIQNQNQNLNQNGFSEDKETILDNIEQELKVSSETESKYKRKKREQQEKEKAIKESIAGFGSLAMNIIISRLPNPIPLNPIESSMLDLSFQNLLDKYFDKFSEWSEELAFVSILVIILAPRIRKKNERSDSDIGKNGVGENNFS